MSIYKLNKIVKLNKLLDKQTCPEDITFIIKASTVEKIMPKQLKKQWKQYCKDPGVMQNPDPVLGVVLSFEGFWQWLLKKGY